MNDEWINVWGPKHFTMIADILARYQVNNFVSSLINSPVGTNLFLQMNTTERFNFVQNLYEGFGKNNEVQEALS